jgi:protein gp37
MAKTKIEWTHQRNPDGTVMPGYTFNPWVGCQKVSAGCQHCYAETLMDTRFGKVQWGPAGTRVRTSDANWRKPLAWNRKAEREGRRYRVFCASLADVFEDREEVAPWRADLFKLIASTKSLDWLLLTKRPENIEKHLRAITTPGGTLNAWGLLESGYFSNVWMGTSVENQEAADKRIPELLKVPAAVRFLSMEPLLGPVDLTRMEGDLNLTRDYRHFNALTGKGVKWLNATVASSGPYHPTSLGIQWVIVGGESGQQARVMHPEWARSLRDQCVAAGVPFFFKQWGTVATKAGYSDRWLDRREWNETP